MKKLSLCLFCWLVASLTFAETLRFSAIPDEDTTKLQERFGKVAAYLSEKLGIEVKYLPVKSYSASVAAFKNNEIQLAWFGGVTGVQARRAVAGSQAIAQGEEDQHFISYLIAHASTKLEPADQLQEAIQGKTFTFGSKDSTSGRLFPHYFLQKHFGKSPEALFARVGFSGDHSKTIALVQSGSYELGVLNYKVWENEVKAGKVDPSQVKVIWKSPEFVDYNWSIRGDVEKNFGEGFIKKVQQALLEMKDPALLESFPRKSFIPASNDLYQPLEETAKSIGLLE